MIPRLIVELVLLILGVMWLLVGFWAVTGMTLPATGRVSSEYLPWLLASLVFGFSLVFGASRIAAVLVRGSEENDASQATSTPARSSAAAPRSRWRVTRRLAILLGIFAGTVGGLCAVMDHVLKQRIQAIDQKLNIGPPPPDSQRAAPSDRK